MPIACMNVWMYECMCAQIRYACASYHGPATWLRPLSCPHCSQMYRYTSLHPALSRGTNGGYCRCGFQTWKWIKGEIIKDRKEKHSKKIMILIYTKQSKSASGTQLSINLCRDFLFLFFFLNQVTLSQVEQCALDTVTVSRKFLK